MAILLALAGLWIAAGTGRAILDHCNVPCSEGLLRFAYSAAVGIGIVSYGVALLGWVGLLSIWPIAILWIAVAAFSWKGIFWNSRDAVRIARRTSRAALKISHRSPASMISAAGAAGVVLLLLVATVTCFKPPAGLEWDAISYHLADPAQFLMARRVYSLPTEHHSNFPLLVEMLYTVSLAISGYALANLFHLMMGAITVIAVFAWCRRVQGSACAWTAALLFASTPVVLWEASVAYVELGLAMYATLAVLAAVDAIAAPDLSERDRLSRLVLCGVCCGFALGVKYLALVPFGLIILFILVKTRSIRRTAICGVIAIMIASPWYVKNAVVLRNPVYPYLYKLFPHSVNWSTMRAAGYESEQARFGTPHSLKQPGVALANLLQVPWDLVTLPDVNPGAYSNSGEYSYMTLIGGLYFAFNVLLLIGRRVRPEVAFVALLGLLQVAAWFFVAQVSRYLVSVLPLLAISGAAGVEGCFHGEGAQHRVKHLRAAVGWFCGLLLGVQLVETLWVTTSSPPGSNIVSISSILEIAQSPEGASQYLEHHLDTYAVASWIDKNTPETDGVLLYDDTRGFYIHRPYLWANEEHSGYIPYSTFKDGQDMTNWMLAHHYRYAMIDMNWAPQNSDRSHADPELQSGPAHNEMLAFQKWYASAPLRPIGSPGYRWRGLVADAYRRGLWTDAGADQNGVMLLHVGPGESR